MEKSQGAKDELWMNCDRYREIWYFKKKEKELPTVKIFKIFLHIHSTQAQCCLALD